MKTRTVAALTAVLSGLLNPVALAQGSSYSRNLKGKKELAAKEIKPEELGQCKDTSCSFGKHIEERTVISKDGLGDSPGIPNLEYLGLGYDILRGNPRGSELFEVDPGFRSRVLALTIDQALLTNDQDYTVPTGTAMKYVSSCNYDSVSTEISSQRDYQKQLSTESSAKTTIAAGGQGSTEAGFSGKIETELAFSKSIKLDKFSSSSNSKNTVSFESKAVCAEFEASFVPFTDKPLDPVFVDALESLPENYNAKNVTHRAAYGEFLSAYGTHYVDQIVLGAKRIYTTTMDSSEVLELTRQGVDIKSTLSVNVQFALGQPKYVKDALAGDTCCKEGTVINNYGGENDDDGNEVPAGVFGKFNYDTFSNSERQFEAIQKISKTEFVVTEINVGGLPPTDENWKTWAASVKDRPMPIFTGEVGLWTLMDTEQQKEDFFAAVADIENLDLTPQKEENKFLDALHFGVSGPQGEPVSSYSLNPSSSFRTLLKLATIPEVRSTREAPQILDVFESDAVPDFGALTWSTDIRAKKDLYACGAKVKYDQDGGEDDEGITEIYLVFCDKDGTRDGVINIGPTSGEGKLKGEALCPTGTFVDGARVRFCNDGKDNFDCSGGGDEELGLYALQISCSALDDDFRTVVTVICDADDSPYNNCIEGWAAWKYLPPSPSTNTTNLVVGGTVKFGSSNDNTGEDVAVSSLRFLYTEVDIDAESGPLKDILTYTAVWEDKTKTPTPVFAQMIRGVLAPNDQEDQPEDLRNFCILAADNLPKEAQYVSGVIHPDGYIMNSILGNSDVGFSIRMKSTGKYVIEFDDGVFDAPPTIVAFPQWILGANGRFPTNVGQLSLFVDGDCKTTECNLMLGSEQSRTDGSHKHLGFNFLALGGSFDNTAIAHGYIRDDFTEAHGGSSWSSAIVVSQEVAMIDATFGNDYTETIKITGRTGGVKITFEPPFLDIPSLIVTPTTDDRSIQYNGLDRVKAPNCIVDHLTKKSAVVKCGWLDTSVGNAGSYEVIGFHFVAAGPRPE